jgi:hypothetical protein
MSARWIAGRSAFAVTFGAAGLVAGGLGVAVASSGGVFILGEHNATTSVTTLSNSKGSALSLKSKHGTAPFTVNSGKVVKHLNSAKVGGSSASQLKTSGSGAATNYSLSVGATLKFQPTAVAATGKLRAGTYYVTATATLMVQPNESGLCTLLTTKPTTSDTQAFQSAMQNFGTATDTRPMTVRAGQKITEYCWVVGGSIVGNLNAAGITAIRVDTAVKGTAIVGHPEA